MTIAQPNLSRGADVAEELRAFLRQKIELGKAEVAKRPHYDDDHLHWAGQVFGYEAALRETDRLLPHPVAASASQDLRGPGSPIERGAHDPDRLLAAAIDGRR